MDTRLRREVNPDGVAMTRVFVVPFPILQFANTFILSPSILNTNHQGSVLGISSKDLSDNFVYKHLQT